MAPIPLAALNHALSLPPRSAVCMIQGRVKDKPELGNSLRIAPHCLRGNRTPFSSLEA